jgi:DNA-binding transcriptional LysR family regulator
MTLRQLRVFRAVCDNSSYSRAAEEMALTQPAVSLQIRQLEELLGQPLFEYTGKKLYLTEAAEALKRTSEDIFGRLESLDMQLSTLQGSLQGQLKLAVESSAKYFAPHLFAMFRESHPEVSLQLVVVDHTQALQRLSANRDDLLLISQVPTDMDLEFLPFLDNAIIAVAPADHPLCQRSHLQLQDLTAWPLLIREPGSGTRRATERYCDQKRAHFPLTMELGSLEAQREGVLAGLGLALLPRHAVLRELERGALRELPVAELPLMRSWCLVHPRGKYLSPVAQTFFAFARSERQRINALERQFSRTC